MGEDEIKDPTEIGVGGLNGIKFDPDPEPDPLKRTLVNSGKYYNEPNHISYTTSRNIDRVFNESVMYNPSGFGAIGDTYGYGNSKYDQEITSASQMKDLEDSRANLQTSWAKWGAGLAKMGLLAGTTVVDNTIGMVYGLGDAIVHGELNRFYNNSLSNWLREFEADMEKELPNYRSETERNRAWYENMGTANFWADTILKNAGFTIGTAAAAAATTALTGGVGGGGLLSKGFGKLAQLFGKGVNATRNYQTGAKVGMDFWYSVGEAHSVASSNYNEWVKEAKEEHDKTKSDQYTELDDWYRQRVAEIEEEDAKPQDPDKQSVKLDKQYLMSQLEEQYKARFDAITNEYNENLGKDTKNAQRAANADFLLESAFLMATNIPGTLRGYKTSMIDAEKNVAIRNGRRARRLATEEAELRRAGKIKEADALRAKHKGNYYKGENRLTYHGKEMLSEGVLEEGGQGVIDDTVKEWYMEGYADDSRADFGDMLNLTFKHMADTYGSAEGLMEVFAGAATAVTGVTMPHRVKQEDGTYKWKIMQGGLFDSDATDAIKASQETAKKLNSVIQRLQSDPSGAVTYAIRNMSIDKLKQIAIENDNKFEAKNKEYEQLINDVLYYKTAGRLDDLKALVGNPNADVSKEELENLMVLTDERDEDGNIITNTMGLRDSSGNPVAMSDEEIRKQSDKIKRHRKEVWDTIDLVSKAMDDIEIQSNGAFNVDEIKALAWLKVFPHNLTKRIEDMDKDIKGNDVFDVVKKELERRRENITKYFDITTDADGNEKMTVKKGLTREDMEYVNRNQSAFANTNYLWHMLNNSALKQYKSGDRGNIIDLIDWGHKEQVYDPMTGQMKETTLAEMFKTFLSQSVNNERVDADEANRLLQSINDSQLANFYINKYREQYNEYMKDDEGKLKLRSVGAKVKADVQRKDFNNAYKDMYDSMAELNLRFGKALNDDKNNGGDINSRRQLLGEYERAISDLWNRYAVYGDEFNNRIFEKIEERNDTLSDFIKNRRKAMQFGGMFRAMVQNSEDMSELEKTMAIGLFNADAQFAVSEVEFSDGEYGVDYNPTNVANGQVSALFDKLTKMNGRMSGVRPDGSYGSVGDAQAIDNIFGDLSDEEKKELDDFVRRNGYYLLSKVSDDLKVMDSEGNISLTQEGVYELAEQAKKEMLSHAISLYQETVSKVADAFNSTDKWVNEAMTKDTFKSLAQEINMKSIWKSREDEDSNNASDTNGPTSWNVYSNVDHERVVVFADNKSDKYLRVDSEAINQGVDIVNQLTDVVNNLLDRIEKNGGFLETIDDAMLQDMILLDSFLNTDVILSVLQSANYDGKKKPTRGLLDRLYKSSIFETNSGATGNPLTDLFSVLADNRYLDKPSLDEDGKKINQRNERVAAVSRLIKGIYKLNEYRNSAVNSPVLTEEANSILDEEVSNEANTSSTMQELIREGLSKDDNLDVTTKTMRDTVLNPVEVRTAAVKNLEEHGVLGVTLGDYANKKLSKAMPMVAASSQQMSKQQKTVAESDVEVAEENVDSKAKDDAAIQQSNQQKAKEQEDAIVAYEKAKAEQVTTLLPQTPQFSIKGLMQGMTTRLADYMDTEDSNVSTDPHETQEFLDKHGAFEFLNNGGLANWMGDKSNPYYGQVYALCDEEFNGGLAPEKGVKSNGGIYYAITDENGNSLPAYYVYDDYCFVEHKSSTSVWYTIKLKPNGDPRKLKKGNDGKNVRLADMSEVECVDEDGNEVKGVSGADVVSTMRKTAQASYFFAVRKPNGDFQVIGMMPKLKHSMIDNGSNTKFFTEGIVLQALLEVANDRLDNLPKSALNAIHDLPWQITDDAQGYHTTTSAKDKRNRNRKIYGYDNLTDGFQAEAYMYYKNLTPEQQKENGVSVKEYSENGKNYIEVESNTIDGESITYVFEEKEMLTDSGNKISDAADKPYNVFFGEVNEKDERIQNTFTAYGASSDTKKQQRILENRKAMLNMIKAVISKRFVKNKENSNDNDTFIEERTNHTYGSSASKRYVKLDDVEIAKIHSGIYQRLEDGQMQGVSAITGKIRDRSGNAHEATFEELFSAGKINIGVLAENKEKEKTLFFPGGQTRDLSGSDFYKGSILMQVSNSAGGTDLIPVTAAKYTKEMFGDDDLINASLDRAAEELMKAAQPGANLDDHSSENVLFKAWKAVNDSIYFPIGKEVHTGYIEGFSKSEKFRVNYMGDGIVNISFGDKSFDINVTQSKESIVNALKDCIEAMDRPLNVRLSIFKGRDKSAVADLVKRGYLMTSLASLNPINTYFEAGRASRDKSEKTEEKNNAIFKKRISELKAGINSLSDAKRLSVKDFVPISINGVPRKFGVIMRNGEHFVVDENERPLSNKEMQELVTSMGTSTVKDGKIAKVNIRAWYLIQKIAKNVGAGNMNSFGTTNKETATPNFGDRGIFRFSTTDNKNGRFVCYDSVTSQIISPEEMAERIKARAEADKSSEPTADVDTPVPHTDITTETEPGEVQAGEGDAAQQPSDKPTVGNAVNNGVPETPPTQNPNPPNNGDTTADIDLDDFVSEDYREETEQYEQADIDDELKWLEKALPQFTLGERTFLVDHIDVVGKKGKKAWGMLKDNCIYLVNNASRGTTYHEAYHAVSFLMLTTQERNEMYDEVRQYKGHPDWSNKDCEEELAEMFRQYVQARELGNVHGFKRIFAWFRSLYQKLRLFTKYPRVASKIFKNIHEGKFANRHIPTKQELIQKEMDEIKANAIANGTFMKAPNGNPTNLNERQWLQVRTRAFKNWFGDWEKVAPKNIKGNLIAANGEINWEYFEQILNDYHNEQPDSMFAKGRTILATRPEKHFEGEGNTLNHIKFVTQSMLDLFEGKFDADLPFVSEARASLQNQKDLMVLAAMFHDVAKPYRHGDIHGWESADILRDIMGIDYNNRLAEWAVRHHMAMPFSHKSEFNLSNPDAVRVAKNMASDAVRVGIDAQTAINAFVLINAADIINGREIAAEDNWAKKAKAAGDSRYGDDISIKSVLTKELNEKVELLKKAFERIGNMQLGNPEQNYKNQGRFDYVNYPEGGRPDGQLPYLGNAVNGVSKVVDENGEPLVVYHASNKQFSVYQPSMSEYGFSSGMFFSSSKRYAEKVANAKVKDAVFLNIKNPMFADDLEREKTARLFLSEEPVDGGEWVDRFGTDEGYEEYVKETNSRKSDGIIGNDAYKYVDGKPIAGEESTEYVTRNSNQIKSADFNDGSFSSDSDDIRYREVQQDMSPAFDAYEGSEMNNIGSEAEYIEYLEDKTSNSEVKGVAYTTDYIDENGNSIVIQTGSNTVSESMSSYAFGDICRELGIKTSVDINGKEYDRTCKPCIVGCSEKPTMITYGKYRGVSVVLTQSKPHILGSAFDKNGFSEYVTNQNKNKSRTAYDENPSSYNNRGISKKDFDSMPDIVKEKLGECV